LARSPSSIGGGAVARTLDVRNRECFARAIESTVRDLGSLDILVNNAALVSRAAGLHDRSIAGCDGPPPPRDRIAMSIGT